MAVSNIIPASLFADLLGQIQIRSFFIKSYKVETYRQTEMIGTDGRIKYHPCIPFRLSSWSSSDPLIFYQKLQGRDI